MVRTVKTTNDKWAVVGSGHRAPTEMLFHVYDLNNLKQLCEET